MSAINSSTSTSTDLIMHSLSRREAGDESKTALSTLFYKLGYQRLEQQLNFMKLLAITQTLPEKIYKATDTLPTDAEAQELFDRMSMDFSSVEEAFHWLLTTTQKIWKRDDSKEGANKSTEANLARWFTTDSERTASIKSSLKPILDNLGFLAGSHWTQVENPPTILLNGGLESHIVERLEALEKLPAAKEGEKIPLCYLTGPRGVFKFEPSLPKILASWFKDDSLIPKFAAVLKEYPKDWNKGSILPLQLLLLSAAKPDRCPLEVMQKMAADIESGKDNPGAQTMFDYFWPKEEGYYARNPEKYDANTTAWWPVAGDIVEHHLNQLKKSFPGKYDYLELTIIVAQGKGGRLANTQDTIQQWLLEKGHDLMTGRPRVVIASLSSQPHVIYMNETTHLCLPEAMDVITLSVDGNIEKMQTATILDVFARYIYTMRPVMEKKA